MKSKKGISALVETVLLVLVAITAVGIVWYAVVPLFKTPAETASLCLNAVDITSATTGGNITVVVLKDINLTRLVINAYDTNGISLCNGENKTAIPSVGGTINLQCSTVTNAAVKVGVIATGKLGTKAVACSEVIEAVA